MKTLVYVSLAIVAALSVVVESGFLVTSPRIFRTGSTYKLAVNLINSSDPWIVSATIRNHWGNLIASGEGKFNSTDEGVLTLKIPRDVNVGPHEKYNAKLSVTGGPEGEKPVFQKSEVATLEIAKKSLFIQTDKPIYKPGQTIRMRIVGVDENLRPLTGKVSRVTIINPTGVRTMQWENLDFAVGIVSLELPLSSQPVLGNWAIEATVQGHKKKQVIAVEKYVLPKFEVTIQPPSFIALDTKEVTATVCARYTYGQPVVGRVNVHVSLKKRYWRYYMRNIDKSITFEKEINGCTDVTILGSHLDISSHLSGKVHINATVTERGTGVTQNATGTVTDVVQYSTNIEFLPTTPNTFKPGMPFRGQMKVTKPDGSPATGEKVVLTVVGNPSNHWWYLNQNKLLKQTEIVPGSGIVDFVVPGRLVQSKYRFLLLKAKPIRAKDSNWRYNNVEHHATPWYSPSNSYVEIEKMTAPVKVGSMAKVKFYFTADKNTNSISFHYQVLSRGKLVEQGQKHQQVVLDDQSVGSGYIQFTVTQEMVPSCRVLLFYVREDGETVADFTLLDVADTLENEVTISFADETRKPGEATKLTIAAAPGSLVAITAVDKSVHLLRGGNELTENDAIGVLSGQDVGPDEDYRRRESCFQPRWWPSLRRRRSIGPYWAESSNADASKAFADSGVIYFSDLKIETAECHRLRPYGRPEPVFERMLLAGGPVSVGAIGNLGPQIPPKKKANKQAKKAQLNIRKQFPETWLWTEEVVNEKTGKVVIRAKVPDTITSWTASAFALSSSAGFGVSSPTSIKVFQPFFVSLTLPYSVIRGEEVSITTSVFNYMDKCLTIRLDFLSSEDYKVISDDSHKVCVCSNEAKSVRFIINPKNLGYIPLTVVAKNIDSSVCKKDLKQMTLGVTDAVIRKLLVEPEGVRQEYTYNSFVCLDDEKPFFTDAINVSLPSNVVPGSVHAVVSTIGDLMGPALNVGTMLRLPYGCGEQNMVNFAPGIYIMKYLSSVDQLSPKIETKAKTIMRSGYQRELTYKRKDGSYSAFGESDREGNMWLTAFVLRSFAQARPFIFVDVDELKVTTAWITKHQKPDGCFPSVGRLFNKRLKGGVSTEATLTAFVSVSLMERGMAPENKVIRKALQCVVQASQNLSDSYSAALFAYTLALARDPRRLQFFKVLQDKAIIEGDLMHWEKVKETEPTILPPWRWYYRAPAADIEMTAYALMTYVLMAEDDTSLIGEAQPIVRWLSKQRNSLGGFSSTQDTCVALQALSKYASNVYSNSTDLTVRFGDQEVYNFSKTFNITNNNRLVSQRAQLPSDLLPILDLPVEVKGSGCALLQADVSYNVPEVEEKPAFDLRVRVKRSDNVFASHLTTETGDELCGPLEMEIAARWLRENTSNMAIIDVKMVSGFQADVDSLEKLKNMPRLKFKRYEIEGAHVVMYFDEIGTVSFSFKIYQSAIVKKTKPASVTVYDYYETEMSAIEMYKIKEALCAPETIDPPPECPICLKGLSLEGDTLSKLCKTKKVYTLDVKKRDNAVYQEIPKPNVTAGGDVNNTSNANERSNATSTAVEFQLNIPTDCKCPILHPGSELYAFVDGVELVPISDNAVLVQRRSLNLGRLWRNLYARCPRNP